MAIFVRTAMVAAPAKGPLDAMYVCLCNGLSDRDIRRAADQGHCNVKSVYGALDAEVNCGRCVSMAHELICEQRRVCNTAPAEAAE